MASGGRALLLSSKIGMDVVTIQVGTGDSQKSFALHKAILCSKAIFFKKMFNSGFIEGISQHAELPEDNPEAFELFVGWVYLDVVEIPDDTDWLANLLTLFAFAEKYGITTLADITMNTLARALKDKNVLPNTYQMTLGYQITQKGSKLRLFMARTFVYVTLQYSDDYSSGTWSNVKLRAALKDCDDLEVDYFAMMRSHNGNPQADPRIVWPCNYHQHESTEPCPY